MSSANTLWSAIYVSLREEVVCLESWDQSDNKLQGRKKLQKITQILFFIQSNGPVRKDTGEVQVAEKDKQRIERCFFYIIKTGIKGQIPIPLLNFKCVSCHHPSTVTKAEGGF